MKSYCKFSNIIYSDNSFEFINSSEWNHPIFNLSYSQLDRLYHQGFLKNRLKTEIEIKLFTIALYKATNYVIFDYPIPIHYCKLNECLLAIPKLIEIHEWLRAKPYKPEQFPVFRINIDNQNYNSEFILYSCEEWQLAIIENSSIYYESQQYAKKEQILESMRRIMSKRHKYPQRFIKHLSQYIISSLSDHIKKPEDKKYYSYIIECCCNLDESYTVESISSFDINFLIELITIHIGFDNQFGFIAISLLKELKTTGKYNKFGITCILEERQKLFNIPEPKQSEYKSFKEYLNAFKDWDINRNIFLMGDGE